MSFARRRIGDDDVSLGAAWRILFYDVSSTRQGASVDFSFLFAAPPWRCLSLDSEDGHRCAAAVGASNDKVEEITR